MEMIINEERELELGEKLNILFHERTGYKFDTMFSKYREKLKWFVMKMCKDEVMAEEITDEAFVKAFYEIEKFDLEKGNFSTWLFTIARNIMIQNIKFKTKFSSIDSEHRGKNGEGATIADFLYADDNTEAIEYNNIIQQKVRIVREEISKLPMKYASILQMREFDALSYQDIAEHLDMNINTVKSRIKKARALLVEKLNPIFAKLERGY